MKPSPSPLLLRTPKPPVVQMRGKSKNSGEAKALSSISSSSDSSSAEAKHHSNNNNKVVVRSLSSDFDSAPEVTEEAEEPSDLPDPDFSFDNHVLDESISFEAFDSPAILSALTVETMEKDENEEVTTEMVVRSAVVWSVWRREGLNLFSDPVFLARFQIGLTLLLISLVALLNVVAVASWSDRVGGIDEWSFSDLPPT